MDGRKYALNCNFVFSIGENEEEQTVLFCINNMQYFTTVEYNEVHEKYDLALKSNTKKTISYKIDLPNGKSRLINPSYIVALGVLNDDENTTEISIINGQKMIVNSPIDKVLKELKACQKTR
jgi:uncharacterized protein YlzI (FlbEa/FlbD family)